MTKKVARLALIICMAGMFLSIVALCFMYFKAKAEDGEAIYSIGSISTEYAVGDSVTIPSGTVTVGGGTYDLSHSVRYPDGRTNGYDEFVVESEGRYYITYSATVGSAVYQKQTFFDGVMTPASLFGNIYNTSFEYNVDSPDYSTDYQYNGVKVIFGEGGTASFRYNGIIDLNRMTKTDPFIEFLVTPEYTNSLEISTLSFRLTDIYDENNYIDFDIRSGDGEGYPYAAFTRASANSMYASTSYCLRNGSMVLYRAGLPVRTSWKGKFEDRVYRANSFSFDAADNTLYAFNPYLYSDQRFDSVLDFDDPVEVGENYVWQGFTTNEVYLTVTATTLTSNASMLISSIGGQSLSGTVLNDTYHATISIDYAGYDPNELPNGVVGKSYPIFDAIAYDPYGDEIKNVDVEIYAPDGGMLPVNKKTFATQTSGEYRIVYVVEYSSRTYTKEISITVLEDYPAGQELSYSFSPVIDTRAYVGDDLILHDGTVNGGIGATEVTREILYNGSVVEAENYGLFDYLPLSEDGTITIRVTVVDMLGSSVTEELQVDVDYKTKPVIKAPYIPKTAIVGRELDFSAFEAYVYDEDGIREVPVTFTVNEVPISGTVYTPQQTGTLTVLVRATDPESTDAVEELAYTITVTDPSQMSRYADAFIALENFAASYSSTAYRLTADTSEENAVMEFANPLPIENFLLDFYVETTKSNFNSITVTLYDGEDASINVQLTIEKAVIDGTDGAYFYINGIRQGTITGSFSSGLRSPFVLQYDYTTHEITDYAQQVVGQIQTLTSGRAFTGFPSGEIWFTLEISGITGESEVILNRVVNQVFSDSTSDITMAVILLQEQQANSRRVQLNSEVMVSAAKGYDVFDSFVDVSVRITAPDGSVVYSGTIAENYYFTATISGQYSVLYTANDSSGITAQMRSSIYVIENTAPSIVVSGVPSTATVGQSITLPEPTVTDDTDDYPEWFVYIYNRETDKRQNVTSMEYIFNEAGSYLIRYIAFDSYYNYSISEFEIRVS